MIAAIALCDLDDTLFSSRRKCSPDVATADLVVGAWGSDGAPLSFSTPAQHRMTLWLQQTALMVPVTARSTGALLRTHIVFDHAISAHGGVVLERSADGCLLPVAAWHESMQAALAPHQHTLEAISARVANEAARDGISVRTRIVEEDGLPLYVVVKHGLQEGNDAELHAACAATTKSVPPGWTVHVNGNNIAYLPPGLGKAHAVGWLLPRLRARYCDVAAIGIGDSFTDASFMALCDYAMLPTRSQLASMLFAARG